jgi:hypothetical protein
MKTAGDILSALFDERFMEKAREYSRLFDSWADITAKNGIASAADHSRIRELDRGVLLVETDHPGWKQILQTKQSKLLNDFRIRFPELEISGISLILAKVTGSQEERKNDSTPDHLNRGDNQSQNSANAAESEKPVPDFENIKDEVLKEKLIKLGRTVASSEKNGRKNFYG